MVCNSLCYVIAFRVAAHFMFTFEKRSNKLDIVLRSFGGKMALYDGIDLIINQLIIQPFVKKTVKVSMTLCDCIL